MPPQARNYRRNTLKYSHLRGRRTGLGSSRAGGNAVRFPHLAVRSTGRVAYAPVVGRARAAGTITSVADGQLAAIAAVHGLTVATRDTAPFRAAGLPVIDPWEAGS